VDERVTILVRAGGACLILFVPLLVIGSVLYAGVGVSSQSGGADALRRVADSGPSFAAINALFHLGALLLIPGGAALVLSLRGGERDGWLLVGTLFLGLAVVVGAGFVFALNHALFKLAGTAAGAPAEAQVAYAVAADANLGTQAGAELVQSLGLSLWLLCVSLASADAGWPTWLILLGVAGGIGFFAAGLSSVLWGVPMLGVALGGLGALGLLLFAAWMIAVGMRLVTLPPA
jgi:hypothetical protein